LTGGNVADITAAATLVSAVAPPGELVGDDRPRLPRRRLPRRRHHLLGVTESTP
jgi:hypothetical protein